MKKYLILVSLIILIACSSIQTEDQQFETLTTNYIEKLLQLKPELATGLGDHRYDHLLNDYSLEGVKKERQLNQVYLDSLMAIDWNKLNRVNQIDYEILRTNIQYTIFRLDTLKEYEWNPMVYNIGSSIYDLMAREFAPIQDRLHNIKQRLEAVPDVLAEAKKNLKNPPKIHTETAILQNTGNINFIQNQLNDFLVQVPDMKPDIVPAQEAAVIALEDYGNWLEQELLPQSTGDFRIGDALFKRKLYYALESDISKEEILQRAEEELKNTQNDMYKIALDLYTNFFPDNIDKKTLENKSLVIKSVLDRLAENHPSNETVVELARQSLRSCTEFVQEQNLVTVPGEPVQVIVMPEFSRGVAIAYCNSPGPLEENAETFFSISPTPKDWTPERVESFFREYNNYMLEDLTIHETMPGHYLQLAHSNKFEAPTMTRAIFRSGTFIEGWATYAEQLMTEFGYGGPEVKMQQLKMRLRLLINAIIDQNIHTAGMTEQEAMDLMMNEGFQEEGEAAGKWRRACLTSTQLSTYFVGNMEINGLRNAYEAKYGMDYDMKTMHDRLLQFGSPAPKYIYQLLDL